LCRLYLRLADALGVVNHLALKVREVDDVVVHDPERPDAGRGEVERGRRAEAARADQQHLSVEQLLLALAANLGNEEMTRIALLLLGREHLRTLEREAAVLPEREAPVHRGDVLVAHELLERVRGERRAL